MLRAKPLTFAPEENARPAPVMTTARNSRSVSNRCSSSSNGVISSSLRALRFSGVFIVRRSTPFEGLSTKTVSAMSIPSFT